MPGPDILLGEECYNNTTQSHFDTYISEQMVKKILIGSFPVITVRIITFYFKLSLSCKRKNVDLYLGIQGYPVHPLDQVDHADWQGRLCFLCVI